MKTTVEIPDRLFREAKSLAAGRGLSLKELLTQALEEKLSNSRRKLPASGWPVPPPNLPKASLRRVRRVIAQDLARIEPEDWK